jgi:SAM-dependent methyltransferase
VVAGVPILLTADHPARQRAAGAPAPALRWPRRVLRDLRRALPHSTRSIGTAARFARLRDLLLQQTGRPVILVVGGGVLGHGMDEIVSDARLRFIETDIYLGPRTEVVCDAHDLPFTSRAFDGVIVQAVLEHVMDPPRVVSEIHRVLKDGGYVYSEVPFMQQVHEGAYDVTRFTLVGHRRLFRCFDEIGLGVLAGPGTAMLWALRYFARAIPRRSRHASNILDALVLLGFFWLKYADDVLMDHAGSVDAASATWFLGTKRATAVSDESVVAGYSGALRVSPR